MLSLRHITKTYETGGETVHALRDVSIDFRRQEFVSVLGPSGCGKTTMLNIVGGLDQYTDGDLVIDGISTKHYGDRNWDTYRNHRVGFVFQSYQLIMHQSVLANVELALTLSGVPKAERRRRAVEALNRVGLGDQLKKRPGQMSGGQMQRVAIARALVNDPDILLADEPTGALDTETSEQIMELLAEVAQDRLVVMVTHNPELAERYSTRIIRLLDGRVTSDTDPYAPTEKELADAAASSTSFDTQKTENVTETSKGKDKKAKKDKSKKTSMSFWTALTLSCNNLLTKKTRTFLTSFAGSIGIVGIALILALSNGIQLYIDRVEEDALSSYPLSLEAVTMDATELIQVMAGASGNKDPHNDGYIHSSDTTIDLFRALLKGVKTNDLKAFKAYIESGECDLADPEVATLEYVYSLTPRIWNTYVAPDGTETLVQANPSDLFSAFMPTGGEGMGAGSFGISLFDQLLDNQELLDNQYQVLAGSWPDAYDEVVLIADANHEINDLYLYALGFKDPAELEALIKDIYLGNDVTTETVKYSYEDLLDRTFTLTVEGDLYTDADGDGVFDYRGEDEAYVRGLLARENSRNVTLKVVGVVCPSKDAAATSATGIVGYTSALTDYLIEQGSETDVVKAQLATPEVDVLTGLPFEMNVPEGMTSADKAAAIRGEYAAEGKSAAELRALYAALLGQTVWQGQLASAAALVGAMPPDADHAMLYMVTAFLLKQNAANLGDYMDTESSMITPETIAGIELDDLQALLKGSVDNGMMSLADVQGMAIMLVAGFGDASLTALDPSHTPTIAPYAEVLGAAMAPSASMTDLELADAYAALYGATPEPVWASLWDAKYAKTSEATYEQNLTLFGLANEDSPSAIHIYPVSFDMKERVLEIIEEYNAGAGEEQKLTYTDVIGVLFSSISLILNIVTYVLVAFVAISLVVSSIMIGIITYISVLERTKEIGILRSIGASKGDVSRVFNAETAIIGAASGVIGIASTLILILPINAIIRALAGVSNIGAKLPFWGGVILVLISIGLTMLAGLIPSRVAARKDPVEALRSE